MESDVAVPPASVFAAPICVPPAEQSPPFAATVVGLQSVKVTDPVGVGWPGPPDTVAVSDASVPGTIPPPVGADCVTVDEVCFTTVKHSRVLSVWDEDEYIVSPE